MREYRKKNRQKLIGQIQGWKDGNREKYREKNRERYHTPEGKEKHRARVQKTHRTWLSHLLGAIKATAKNPGPHDHKEGPQRDFDIDLDYVCDLWEWQKGRCELTGIQMTHRYHDLLAVSIDRIDSSLGHVRGNIQLICQGMNFAKRHASNADALAFVGAIVAANAPQHSGAETKNGNSKDTTACGPSDTHSR